MKYLLYCGPGIGDLLILLPYAKAIKMADPDAFVKVFVAARKNRFQIQESVFLLQHWIDEMDCYNVREAAHIASFLIRLGYRKYDYALIQQYTDDSATSIWPMWIGRWAAKKTCGFQTKHNHRIHYYVEIPRVPGRSVRKNWEELLKALQIPVKWNDDSLLDGEILERIRTELKFVRTAEKPCVALAVGTAPVSKKIDGTIVSNDAKQWDIENWVALAEKLAEDHTQVILVGDKKDAQALENAGLIENCGIQNWTGKTNVAQSAAIISACDLLVCCDTGMLHVADAVGTPLLALFGCTDPGEYCPPQSRNHYIWLKEPCAPCFATDRAVFCREKTCMKRITVNMVYDEINRLIDHEN